MIGEHLRAEARRHAFGPLASGGLALRAVESAADVERFAWLIRLPATERDPARAGQSLTPLCGAVQKSLSDGDQLLALVEIDGESVGALWMRLYAGQASPALALHLQEIVLVPALRSQGHGARLLEHLEALARAIGAREVTLNHMSGNTGAARFYARHQYAQRGFDFGKRLWSTAPPAPAGASNGPRPARPEEAGQVARFVLDGALLCRFTRPDPDPETVAQEARAACERGQILLTTGDGEIDGVCWFTREDSRITGKPLLVTHALGSPRREASVLELLDGLLGSEPEPDLSEILITLWEPPPTLLTAVQERGYALGRCKLSKRLRP